MKKQLILLAMAGALATLAACNVNSNVSGKVEINSEVVWSVEDPSANTQGNAELEELENDLSPIVGLWYERDVLDARELTVNEDGSYVLEYRGGGAEYGDVAVEFEDHPDGSKSRWYVFYGQDGNEWASFAIDEEDGYPTDIYSGQDGEMHFERAMEANVPENSVSADEFVGVWSCGRAYISIEENNGEYPVSIKWGNSAAETTYWNYTCTYDEEFGMLMASDGTRVEVVFEDTESEPKETVVYENGVGKFYLNDGKLTWIDEEEDAGSEMEFTKE